MAAFVLGWFWFTGPALVTAKTQEPMKPLEWRGDWLGGIAYYDGGRILDLEYLKRIVSASGDAQAIGGVEAAQRDKVLGAVGLGLGAGSIGVGALIALDDGNKDHELPQALCGAGFGLCATYLLMDWFSGMDAAGAVRRYNRVIGPKPLAFWMDFPRGTGMVCGITLRGL